MRRAPKSCSSIREWRCIKDRIFAFTPKGELIQLPEGRNAGWVCLCCAYRSWRPHGGSQDQRSRCASAPRCSRTATRSKYSPPAEAQHPRPSWLRFVATGKARAGGPPVRSPQGTRGRDRARGARSTTRLLLACPPNSTRDALKRSLKKLKIENEDELMIAIARKQVSDEALMEALMLDQPAPMLRRGLLASALPSRSRGLTPGVAYHLAQCCHPVPGDRVVGASPRR